MRLVNVQATLRSVGREVVRVAVHQIVRVLRGHAFGWQMLRMLSAYTLIA